MKLRQLASLGLAFLLLLGVGCSSGASPSGGGSSGSGSGSSTAASGATSGNGGAGNHEDSSGGGGTDSGAATPGTSGSSSAAEDLGIPKSPVKVTIAYPAISHTYGPTFVAADLGYFAENNLDVELQPVESSAQLAAAFVSGSIDISPGDVIAGLTAISKGIDLVFLASDRHSYSQQLWAKPDVQPGPGLKGKVIAVSAPGSVTHYAIRDYLTRHGLDPEKDVILQDLGGTSTRAAALDAGHVEVNISAPPQGIRSRETGHVVIDDLADIPHMSAVYMATREFVDANPEVIRGFMRGYLKGLAKVRTDYEGTKDILAKYTQIKDEAINKESYDFNVKLWQKVPRVDPELVRKAIDKVPDQEAAQKIDIEHHIREEFLLEQIENGYLESFYTGEK